MTLKPKLGPGLMNAVSYTCHHQFGAGPGAGAENDSPHAACSLITSKMRHEAGVASHAFLHGMSKGKHDSDAASQPEAYLNVFCSSPSITFGKYTPH